MLRLGQECTELICCIQTSWIISSVQVQSSSKSVYRQRVYAMSGNLQRGVSYHVECPASVCLHTSPWHFAYLQHWLWTESAYLSLYAQILMKTIEGRWKPGSAKESNKRHGSWVGLVALRVTVFRIRYGQKQVCVCVWRTPGKTSSFDYSVFPLYVAEQTPIHLHPACLSLNSGNSRNDFSITEHNTTVLVWFFTFYVRLFARYPVNPYSNAIRCKTLVTKMGSKLKCKHSEKKMITFIACEPNSEMLDLRCRSFSWEGCAMSAGKLFPTFRSNSLLYS